MEMNKQNIMEIVKEALGKENCIEKDGMLFVEKKKETKSIIEKLHEAGPEIFNEFLEYLLIILGQSETIEEKKDNVLYFATIFPRTMELVKENNTDIKDIINNNKDIIEKRKAQLKVAKEKENQNTDLIYMVTITYIDNGEPVILVLAIATNKSLEIDSVRLELEEDLKKRYKDAKIIAYSQMNEVGKNE